MMKIKKVCYLLLVCLLLLSPFGFVKVSKVEASTPLISQVQAFRAVWVSYYANDISSYVNEEYFKKQMNEVLNKIQSLGLNVMVFHVRTHNDALYNSTLNPRASWWSNVNFDNFDPLEWLIGECHSRGVEFHAWLNPYRVTSQAASINDIVSKYRDYPSNPASDSANLLVSSSSVILNPGIPAVREHIIDTCMELIEKYDIDAIHFDDYFYISNINDQATRDQYNTENLSIADFRRQQIDILIESLHHEITDYNIKNQKAVQLGISPSGIYQNGSYPSGTTPQYNEYGDLTYPLFSNTSGFAHYGSYLYSDTKKWIDNEWIDYIIPQSYWAISHTSSSFTKLTQWWSWAVKNKKVNLYMGHGIYMAAESGGGSYSYWRGPDEIYNQLKDMEQYEEIKGSCFYKYATFSSSVEVVKNAVAVMKENWNQKIPGATVNTIDYLPVIKVPVVTLQNGILSFDAVDNVRGYMIWKVPFQTKLDMNNAEHLYQYTQATSLEVELGYDYYVSTVNLANQISEATIVNSFNSVDEITAAINRINPLVTVTDLELIEQTNSAYQALPTNDKNKVYNYPLLQTYVVAASQLSSLLTTFEEVEDIITSNQLLPLQYQDYYLSWRIDDIDQHGYNILTGVATKAQKIRVTYTISREGYIYEKTLQLAINHSISFDKTAYLNQVISDFNPSNYPTLFLKQRFDAIYQTLSESEKLLVNDYSDIENYYNNLLQVVVSSQTKVDSLMNNFIQTNNVSHNEQGYNAIVKAYHLFIQTSLVRASSISELDECYVTMNNLISQYPDEILYQEQLYQSYVNELTYFFNHFPYNQAAYSSNKLSEIAILKEQYLSQLGSISNLTALFEFMKNSVETLKQIPDFIGELNLYREEAVADLREMVDVSLYSAASQLEIEIVINDFIRYSQDVDTFALIDEIKADSIRRLQSILTIEGEQLLLKKTIDELKEQLMEYRLYNNYLNDGFDQVVNIVDEYLVKIGEANTIANAQTLYGEALDKINAIPLNQALITKKQTAIIELENLVEGIKVSDEGQALIDECLDENILKIKKALTISEVDELLTSSKKAINALGKEYKIKEGCQLFGYYYVLLFVPMCLLMKRKKS